MIGVLRGRFGPHFFEFVSHVRVGAIGRELLQVPWARGSLGNPLSPIALLMVFRKISKDVKDRALDLCYQGLVPQDICDLLGVSSRSLSRWRHNQDLYGSTLPPPTRTAGRPRILSGEQVLSICEQLNRAPEMYLDEIQDWIALTMQTSISKSALSTLIQDAGYSFKMLHKAASERDEEERAMFRSWARDTVTAEMVVTADESSKDNRTIFRRWGRSVRGTPAGVHTGFTRGQRYSILAAISVDGYVATRIVIGAVDGDEFFDFIVSEVVRPRVSTSFPIHSSTTPAAKHEPLSRASKRPHPR